MTDEQWKIFQDVSNDIDETWIHVAILGGMVDRAYDTYQVARNYKTAGDLLIEKGLQDVPAYDLIYPVMFLYRHAVELYLKAIMKPAKRNHSLSGLFTELQQMLKAKHGTEVPDWFANWISEFIKYDEKSTTFRYCDKSVSSLEVIINMP